MINTESRFIAECICEIRKTKNPQQISEWAEKITGIKSMYVQYLGFDCANKSLGYTVAFYNKSAEGQLTVLQDKLLKSISTAFGTEFSTYKNAFATFTTARTFAQKTKMQIPLNNALNTLIAAINTSKGDIANEITEYLLSAYFITITRLIPVSYGVVDLIPGKKVIESGMMERTRSLKQHLSKISVLGSAIILVEDQPTVITDGKSTTVQDQICYAYSEWDVRCVPPRWKNRMQFGPGLSYEEIRAKYKKKYTANKAHSKANFLKYINVIGEERMLAGISKENYDDLADSCMQILAYEQFKDSAESI